VLPGAAQTIPHLSDERGRRAAWGAWAAVAVVVLVQVWTVSGGRWSHWPTYSNYYQQLADAFRSGQTCLLELPDPALLALPDPYDPAANHRYALHDASLYRGRYYLYWGPVPALLLAAVNAVFRVRSVPDQVLVFTFAAGTVVFATLLLTRVRQRHFPDTPAWTLWLAVLTIGLATPGPFNLARAMVYEASINAAQMFFVAGLYFAIVALDRPPPSSSGLLMAGLCLACAAGSRASMALAVVGAAIWTARRAFRTVQNGADHPRPRSAMVPLLALSAPLLAAGAALAAYNYARFGSPTELGIRYQLAGFHSYNEYTRLTGARNIIPNLRSYLVEPIPEADLFPFVRVPPGPGDTALADFIRRPVFVFARETPAGLLWVVPFACFALVPLKAPAGARFLPRWARASPQTRDPDGSMGWIVSLLALCIPLLASPALILTVTSSSMRYQADWTTTLLLLAMIGFWTSIRRLAHRPRWREACCAAGVALAAITILAGPLLAVMRSPGHFTRGAGGAAPTRDAVIGVPYNHAKPDARRPGTTSRHS
jgi:hypothetical protein